MTGSGKVPEQVPNHGFREGSGAGSEPRVPRRFWGRFRTTGSGKVPGQFFEPRSEPRVPGRFRGRFRTTSSGKVPGQVLNDRFRAGFEPRSEPQVPGRFRGRFRFTSSGKSTVYVSIFNIYSHNGNGHE